jgi:hypothetical protein
MDSVSRRKNLLDIEHQKYLSYFNILSITVLTSGFTIVWARILNQIDAPLFNTAILILITVFTVPILIIHKKMQKVRESIEAL